MQISGYMKGRYKATWKVDIRLPGKGSSNSHGARPKLPWREALSLHFPVAGLHLHRRDAEAQVLLFSVAADLEAQVR